MRTPARSTPLWLLSLLGAAACADSSAPSATAPPPEPGPLVLELPGGKLGQAVALWDLDGDGADELVAGAPWAMHEGALGVVVAFASGKDGAAPAPLRLFTGDENFGSSVANVGDLDGDGLAELAVGAMNGGGPGGGLSGSVSVLAGGTGAVRTRLAAGMPLAKFGHAIAAGDFDADGDRDLAIGAPFDTTDPALFQAGAIHLFLGPELTEHRVIAAIGTTRDLGWSLAAGDVSGDGLDDLLLGANGKVLGLHGGPGFPAGIDAAELSISATDGGFGRGLVVLGDLDGDGYREFAIGAPTANIEGERDTGTVHLLRGGPGGRAIQLGEPPPPELLLRLTGGSLFARFGAPLAATADLDGDGKGELLVGAPMEDATAGRLEGRIQLFLSSALLAGGAVTGLATPGSASHGLFGRAFAPATDGTVLVGAPGDAANAGAIWLVQPETGAVVSSGSGSASAFEHEHGQ